jgi:DNA-binding CsgD family transcriptional regulator
MKHKFHAFFWLAMLLFVPKAASQTTPTIVYTLTNEDSKSIPNFEVLADKGYTFEQVRTDTTLLFTPTKPKKGPFISPDSADAYWLRLKIYNPFAYAEKCIASAIPMTDNTLYHYDENQKKWLTYRNGLHVNNGLRNIWSLPCTLQAHDTSVLYIKVNIAAFRSSTRPIDAGIWIEKHTYIAEEEHFIALATGVTVLIFILFLLYNSYIYFVFKDKTYFYYLIAQIGGLIFILTDQFYFNVLLPFRVCVVNTAYPRYVLFHDINAVIGDLAIALILYGYVQITRIYLNIPTLMPRLNKWLKCLFVIFLIGIFLNNILIFTKIIPLTRTSYLGTNLLTFFVVVSIIYTSILSYVRGYKWARYFLIANGIPIIILFIASFYYFFAGVVLTTHHALFANFGIVAQEFCLALALVQRVLLIREDLKQKQLEAQELGFENNLRQAENNLLQEKLAANERELTIQNSLRQAENNLLQEKLASNQRELASATLYISQKNELLIDLKANLQTLSKKMPEAGQAVIKNIEAVIKNNLYLDDDWERFRIHFEDVHPDFFKNLQTEHPTLTKNEIRLCAYFHLNLSTKEIANLLNIDPASVRKAKMRLNKKMNNALNLEEEA